jgi:hypothetical protein
MGIKKFDAVTDRIIERADKFREDSPILFIFCSALTLFAGWMVAVILVATAVVVFFSAILWAAGAASLAPLALWLLVPILAALGFTVAIFVLFFQDEVLEM